VKYSYLRINTGILFILFTGVLFGQNIKGLVKNFNAAKSDTSKISIVVQIVSKTSRKEPAEGLIYAKKGYAISKNITDVKYKISAALSLAQAYYYSDSNEQSIVFNKEAIEFLKKEKNTKQLANVYLNLCKNYNEIGKAKEAKAFAEKVVSLSQSANDKTLLARAYTAIGSIEYRQANYEAGIKAMYKALNIYEQVEMKIEIARTARNIGLFYENIELLEEAQKMIRKSLHIFEALKDTDGVSDCYGSLGSVKSKMKDSDSAVYFIKKQLVFLEKFPDKNAQAMALGNLAITYKDKKDYKSAEEQLLKVKSLFDQMNDERLSVVSSVNLGDLYSELKQYPKALSAFYVAMNYGLKTGEKDILAASYDGLRITYREMKDYKNALEFYQKSIALKDSMFSQANLNKIASIEGKYKSEKIETENKLLRSQNALTESLLDAADEKAKSTRYKVYALAFGLLLMIALSFISLRAYRQKRKNNILLEEKNTIITKQRDQVETQKEVLEVKNKEILDSINYAKRLQDAILPPLAFFNQNLPNSFVLFKPKDIVAGDFYWMEKVSSEYRDGSIETKKISNLILFAAADCTGHGVPGALVSVVCSNALNRAVKEFGIVEPGKILDKVKELVVETFEKSENEVSDGMDISLCSFNPQSNELCWAGANNALWIIKKGEHEKDALHSPNTYSLSELKPNKQPIGSSERSVLYTTHSVQLSPSDSIYLFTDGFVDQFGGPTGKKFKSMRFKETLLAIQDLSMQEQRNKLEKFIEEWKGDLEQVDDVCVIGFRI